MGCNDKKDEKTTPTDPCDHEQQKEAAAKAHQHEACIFVAFGWVNATGAVNVTAMLKDFGPDKDLENAMTSKEGGYKECIKRMMEEEADKAKEMMEKYSEDCTADDFTGFSDDEKKEQESAMAKQLAYGAEARCAMIEL